YSYVRNNPVNFNDPSGHTECSGWLAKVFCPLFSIGDGILNLSRVGTPEAPPVNTEMDNEATANGLGWGLGFILSLTDVGDGWTLATGRDTHLDEASTGDRVMSGVGLAAPVVSGRVLSWADEAAESAWGFFRRLIGRACSFSGDTEVVMADGTTKLISEIEVGDWVLAHDPETGQRGPRNVTHVWVHEDTLVDLEIGGDRVTTTEDHPFWNVTDQEWQRADALGRGDLLLTAYGTTIPVDGIDWTTTSAGAAFNLTVADIHTYHVTVGDQSVLVHNTRCDELVGRAADFDADELAQFAYQHAGEGDFPSTPSIDQISDALKTDGVRLADQNAVRFTDGDTVVIINEDNPMRSTAYIRGGD
ncbi:polymorphic toxin-type HINT domain-containing protein, partial [Actinomycetota bacterium]